MTRRRRPTAETHVDQLLRTWRPAVETRRETPVAADWNSGTWRAEGSDDGATGESYDVTQPLRVL